MRVIAKSLPAPGRNLLLAIALSMLAHAMLLALPMSRSIPSGAPIAATEPFNVQIVAAPAALAAYEAPEPETGETAAQPGNDPAPHPAPRPAPMPRRPQKVVEAPLPRPQAAANPTPSVDMLAMIAARRAQRESDLGTPAPPAETPREDPASAALNRNLQTLTDGAGDTSGIFHILSMGKSSAEFAFNGWRGGSTHQWRQVIVVEAARGEPIELAVVRRMIELIRTHYTENFNWNSRRLGRIVVLSARAEDQAGLEDFLMREFFDTPLPAGRQAAR